MNLVIADCRCVHDLFGLVGADHLCSAGGAELSPGRFTPFGIPPSDGFIATGFRARACDSTRPSSSPGCCRHKTAVHKAGIYIRTNRRCSQACSGSCRPIKFHKSGDFHQGQQEQLEALIGGGPFLAPFLVQIIQHLVDLSHHGVAERSYLVWRTRELAVDPFAFRLQRPAGIWFQARKFRRQP